MSMFTNLLMRSFNVSPIINGLCLGSCYVRCKYGILNRCFTSGNCFVFIYCCYGSSDFDNIWGYLAACLLAD